MTDLSRLREIAEKATQGEWWIENDSEKDYEAGISYSEWPSTLHGPKNVLATRVQAEAGLGYQIDEIPELGFPDAEFIATFNPEAVLGLLDRLEWAEDKRDWHKEQEATLRLDVEKLVQALDRIREAVSGHPECDKYEEGDPVTCGWKRAYQSVVAALKGVEK